MLGVEMDFISSLTALFIASSVGLQASAFDLEYVGPLWFKYWGQSNLDLWKLWILMEV